MVVGKEAWVWYSEDLLMLWEGRLKQMFGEPFQCLLVVCHLRLWLGGFCDELRFQYFFSILDYTASFSNTADCLRYTTAIGALALIAGCLPKN